MSKQPLNAITLHQPWAGAIAYLGKDIENRSWRCPLPIDSYLAIHSGSDWDDSAQDFIEQIVDLTEVTKHWHVLDRVDRHYASTIVAIAQFAGNADDDPSPWFVGEVGWKLKNIVPIDPVYCSGKPGLWTIEGDTLDRVRANYAKAIRRPLGFVGWTGNPSARTPQPPPHDIYTFGYGNRQNFDKLADYLDSHQIAHIIDVRRNPQAWTQLWSAEGLQSRFLQYQSIPELGNTSGTRLWLPPDRHAANRSIDRVIQLMHDGNVMLMCAELDPQKCHRSEVAIAIQERTACNIIHKL